MCKIGKYETARYMVKVMLAIILLMPFVASAQQNENVVLTKIKMEGNNITKASVIQRELLVKVGDTIESAHFDELLNESRENVLNTSAFNFVDFIVDDDSDVPDGKILTIKVIERWRIWPVPYLRYADRNIMTWFNTGDISRLSYGFDLVWKNMWGLLHELDMTMIMGYNQKYALTYNIPYLTDKQHLGLEASFGYTRDKEVAFGTVDDKVQYYKGDADCPHKSVFAYVKPYYRFGYRNRLFLRFQYNDETFSDVLVALNPSLGNGDDGRFRYLTLSAVFKNDYRDDHNYPLDGHYLELEAAKIGLGVFDNEPDVFYGKVTADYYVPISNRFYWASNVTARVSPDSDAPYFLKKGLGYGNDYVRTLDLYVVDALNFAVFKNNLKFALLKPVTKNILFIKNERFGKIHVAFYANLFFDFAYTWNVVVPPDTSSRLANQWIYGTGIGLDFVTYYDKVFRLEYGVNGLGEWGFYIHFVAPI